MRLQLVFLMAMLACGSLCAAQIRFERGQTQQAPDARNPQWAARQDPYSRVARGPVSQQQQAERLYLTGRGYIEQGYYGEGLDAINQSLALRPGNPRALTYKGIALRALREPRLALQQFDEALAAAPGDGVAHGERGLTHIVLGNAEKARADLQLAGRARPDLVPWFTQQSKRLVSMQPRGAPDSAQPFPTDPVQSAPTISEAKPSPAVAQTDAQVPDSDSKPGGLQVDWAGAWSLVQPAIFLVLGFLLALLALRVAFAILGRLLRRIVRPWKSGLPSNAQPSPSHENPFQNASSRLTSEPSSLPTMIAPRPTFRQRHRGLLMVTGLGLVVMLAFSIPVLVQAFRLDADKLTAPRVRPTVLDFRGNIYTHLGAPDSPIQFTDLPSHLVDALRAREDSRFFEHHGVDWFGLARALVADVRHMRIKQGASTLTMQLVEKVYQLEQKGVLNRVRSKLVEWTMALRGEAALARKLGDRRAAKEAIMVAYLNRVEFGDGTVGVGAASLYFFEKPVAKLTLGESCMLVALLRAPYANSPYRKPENSRLARDKIVAQMLRRGYITEEEATQAKFHVVNNPQKPRRQHNGYLVAAITREMNSLVTQAKLPKDVWEQETLSIGSTLDLWAQDILDSEVRKVCSSFTGDTKADPLAGAGMLMDNATGQIRALVSGQDYSQSQYDLAFSSRRQVASIAKPFVYGAYLEEGGNIEEVISNAPLTADEIRALNDWNPKNASSLKVGMHPISSGLAFSDNNITVRVGLEAGLRRVYDALYSAGLVSDKTTTGTTWLLGTFESSLANVVSAYSAFPRGGTRATPYLVQSVTIDGKEIYRAEPQTVPLFTNRITHQIHRGLREAMTDGTGKTAVRNVGLDASIAGKTGTSQNAADVWWVGYVKEITLGVRFGRDSNAPLGSAAAGGTLAAPVAARVLKKLSERYSLKDVAKGGV